VIRSARCNEASVGAEAHGVDAEVAKSDVIDEHTGTIVVNVRGR
jgi:hypothetical protein